MDIGVGYDMVIHPNPTLSTIGTTLGSVIGWIVRRLNSIKPTMKD